MLNRRRKVQPPPTPGVCLPDKMKCVLKQTDTRPRLTYAYRPLVPRVVPNKVTEEEQLKSTRTSEKSSSRTTLALALLVLIVAVVYFVATRNSSVQNAFSSIKE